jgi:hypothetical protein
LFFPYLDFVGFPVLSIISGCIPCVEWLYLFCQVFVLPIITRSCRRGTRGKGIEALVEGCRGRPEMLGRWAAQARNKSADNNMTYFSLYLQYHILFT